MIFNYSKDELQQIVDTSTSRRQVLIKLGKSPAGGAGYETLQRKFKEFDIDVSHLLNHTADKKFKHNGFGSKEKYSLDEILVKDSPITQKVLRNYIKRHQVIPYRCNKCECNGQWQNGIITLELDHINGDNKDNRKENLRYLCPNCHALTETYRGKNKRLKQQ